MRRTKVMALDRFDFVARSRNESSKIFTAGFCQDTWAAVHSSSRHLKHFAILAWESVELDAPARQSQ